MMKRTVRAGGLFLGESGRGVSKSIAVGTRGVAVSLGRFLDFVSQRVTKQGRLSHN